MSNWMEMSMYCDIRFLKLKDDMRRKQNYEREKAFTRGQGQVINPHTWSSVEVQHQGAAIPLQCHPLTLEAESLWSKVTNTFT